MPNDYLKSFFTSVSDVARVIPDPAVAAVGDAAWVGDFVVPPLGEFPPLALTPILKTVYSTTWQTRGKRKNVKKAMNTKVAEKEKNMRKKTIPTVRHISRS